MDEIFGEFIGILPSGLETIFADPLIGSTSAFFAAFIPMFIMGYVISWYRNYWRRRSQLKTLRRWRVH